MPWEQCAYLSSFDIIGPRSKYVVEGPLGCETSAREVWGWCAVEGQLRSHQSKTSYRDISSMCMSWPWCCSSGLLLAEGLAWILLSILLYSLAEETYCNCNSSTRDICSSLSVWHAHACFTFYLCSGKAALLPAATGAVAAAAAAAAAA